MKTTNSLNKEREIRQFQNMKNYLGKAICECLDNEDVMEIMINPDSKVFVEDRKNGMYLLGNIDPHDAVNFVKKAAEVSGRPMGYRNILDTRLPEPVFGRERLHADLPPVCGPCPHITLRKPAKYIYPIESYLNKKMITKKQVEAILKAISDRCNILTSGGPGTGKTTFTNAIINELPRISDPMERILILEDVQEIQCQMQNVVPLLTDEFGTEPVTMQELVKSAMRSRPDRIFLGEVRDGAALDMLKAWNTGTPGGVCTVHSNTAESSLLRIVSLSQEAIQTPPYDLVSETINVMVNIRRSSQFEAGRYVHEVSINKGWSNQKQKFEIEQIA